MERLKFSDGVHDISNEDYHNSTAISRSALMELEKSPYHYWYKYISGCYLPPLPTDAMRVGDAFHTYVLEPQFWDERFVVAPKVDRRTKAGKEAWGNFEEESGDRVIISSDEFEMIEGMCLALRGEGRITEEIIAGAAIEKSFFFTHEPTGMQCKARPDILRPGMAADLKSCKDASYREFQRTAYNHDYFLQAAMVYEALKFHGYEMKQFVFLAVEKVRPYAVGVYVLDPEALEWGRFQLDSLMDTLARLIDENKWVDTIGYGVQHLRIPGYATLEFNGE